MGESLRRQRIRRLMQVGLTGAKLRSTVRAVEHLDAEHQARIRELEDDYARQRRLMLEDYYREIEDLKQLTAQELDSYVQGVAAGR